MYGGTCESDHESAPDGEADAKRPEDTPHTPNKKYFEGHRGCLTIILDTARVEGSGIPPRDLPGPK